MFDFDRYLHTWLIWTLEVYTFVLTIIIFKILVCTRHISQDCPATQLNLETMLLRIVLAFGHK